MEEHQKCKNSLTNLVMMTLYRKPESSVLPHGPSKGNDKHEKCLFSSQEFRRMPSQRPCLWIPLKLTIRFPFLGISGSTHSKTFFLK